MTPRTEAPADLTPTLLRLLEELTHELQPGRQPRVRLESRLDQDLGLDSLARVELLARLERRFQVSLPDRAAVEAETVADLRLALQRAAGGGAAAAPSLAPAPPPETPRDDPLQDLPHAASTLIEVLDWHAARRPDRTQVLLYDDDGGLTPLTFADLLEDAERVAAGLLAHDLEPQQAVAIMLPTCRGFFAAFFGALLAGGIPTPIYPPTRPSQVEEHLRRQAVILATARAGVLVTVSEAKRLASFLCSQVPTLRAVATPEELSQAGRRRGRPVVGPLDTAFLQFTSGSTGDPKGVVLTHANLLANLRVIGATVGPTPDDVFVSWLPLYHDMGLIGAVLCTLYHGVPLVLLSPLRFLLRPERWLEAIHRHRGTLSAAPNFAYALCARKVPEELLAQLDLSRWRMTLNGAEPISREVMDRFQQRFARCGLRPEAMTPTYGLAECSLGLTMSPLERVPRVDRVQRAAFSRTGRAEPARGDEEALEFVCCGAPLAGHEVRVVGRDGREVEERREGRVQFRGPSATRGYLSNPAATAALVRPDGWLDSGDLGYVADGELYVTGRVKDVIIRAGRNVYPHELEEAVGEVEGIRKGCVVVFGARRPGDDTERLVVAAETREADPERRAALRDAVLAVSARVLDNPADEVLLLPPHAVLKTSSGKVRRAACRELYERGALGKRGRAPWLQVARMAATGWVHGLRRRGGDLSRLAYAGRFWGAFGAAFAGNWVLVLVLPGQRLRWLSARAAARLMLRLGGVPWRSSGVEHLAGPGPVVAASNHASYLDNVVLAAILPPGFAPVAKQELERNPITRPLLRRLGTIFVERFDRGQGAEHARRLPEALRSGRSVLIFPEGTCLRMPGLLPFHMGAFLAAAETGSAVVPVALRGSRSVLRPDTWFPRAGAVEVEVGPPLRPRGSDWAAAVELRDAVRAWILARCGEPDLVEEDPLRHLSPGR